MTNNSANNTKREKSLLEIIQIIFRGRLIIISSTILFLILAYLYNKFTSPIYESKAILKKEVADNTTRDELSEIVRLQTLDRLETEMELVKTGEVLSRVIDRLNLRIELKSIVDPSGESYELSDVLIDFPDSGSSIIQQIPFSFPVFKDVELKSKTLEKELYIIKIDEKHFELRDVIENKLISSIEIPSVRETDTSEAYDSTNTPNSIPLSKSLSQGSIFNNDFARFEFSWPDAPVGSKVYFDVTNYYQVITNLGKRINVSRVGHTDVFELSVLSSSPVVCKVIADQIINSFREVRMEQQKQTVRYSFHFVDEQLTEIQSKLLDAEHNLSNFKGSGQIMTIDSQTEEIMDFLSTLEAEKLQAELLLSNYKDKAEEMKKELQASGYFDPSLLEPSVESQGRSPFSELLTHLSNLEMQKLELLQKRTENHPEVVKISEQINLAKEKLASYNQNTLTSYTIIINTLEKKLQKINSLMSGYQVQMQQLPAQETQIARLVREKDVYEKIFKLLLDKREEMRVAELSQLQDIIIVDPPYEPFKPIKPRKLFNMAIALFLGGFIGIISVFLLELRKTRFIDLDYLEQEFRLPILALIPKFDKSILNRIKKHADEKDLFVTMQTDNLGIRESYRLLNTKLFQLDLRDKTLLVTSCEENSGKTTIVANLAVTMALNDKNVLIIDCDLRKGELSKMFNLFHNSPGIIDYIEKGSQPAIYTKVLKKLNIIPAGGLRENSSVLLSSDRMKSLFQVIDTSVYDFIIIDTPPVTRVVDALAMGMAFKNAILVVRPNVSIKESVIGGIQELNQSHIKIRGIVANAVEIQKSYYYRYRYGYGYGYSNQENKKFMSKIGLGKKSHSKVHKLKSVSHS